MLADQGAAGQSPTRKSACCSPRDLGSSLAATSMSHARRTLAVRPAGQRGTRMSKTRTPAPAERRPARHAPASALSVLRWSRGVHWALVGAVAVAGTAVAFEYGAGRGS